MSDQSELERLIAEQAKDMRMGDRVWSLSLNANRDAGDHDTSGLIDLITIDSDGAPSFLHREVGGFNKPMSALDSRHGTVNGYSNLRCRCQPCRDAWSAFLRIMRERRRQGLPGKGGYIAPHGTASRYQNWMCRCPECQQAYYERMVATGKTPGTRPRLLVVRFAKVVATTSPKVELNRKVREHHAYRAPVLGMCAGFVDLGPSFTGLVRCSFRAKQTVNGLGYCKTHAKKATTTTTLTVAA